ncbi:hypothetical protein ZP9_00039 [Shewanella phage ZP9]|nr:hypothetical protein ZP9_00039 [Shewanella phage ZP9]
MRTVKDFENAGVEFVSGDKCKDDDGCYTNGWVFYRSQVFDTCELTEFAWRDLTTKPDNAKFKIELDIYNHRWRPSLNQGEEWPDEQRVNAIGQNGNDGLHYENTAQQFESLAINKQAKPVFTQAMADAGELPPVGSEVALRYKFDSKQIHIVGKVLYASTEHCIIDGKYQECHKKMCDYTYEPIPKTITANGFEVLEPVRENLDEGCFYYAASVLSRDFCEKLRWAGDSTDFSCLSRGLIHSTKEAAIAHAKAMLGIDPNA